MEVLLPDGSTIDLSNDRDGLDEELRKLRAIRDQWIQAVDKLADFQSAALALRAEPRP